MIVDAEQEIRDALTRFGKETRAFASVGNCSLGEAVVILMRLERQGVAERSPGAHPMRWRLAS